VIVVKNVMILWAEKVLIRKSGSVHKEAAVSDIAVVDALPELAKTVVVMDYEGSAAKYLVVGFAVASRECRVVDETEKER
jgi:hypothetical protein